MNETWYVMEDGSAGDPREIAAGKDGRLAHRDGRKVAYAAHGPRSRSVDAAAERAKSAAGEKKLAGPPAGKTADDVGVATAAPSETRDMKAEEPKRAYKTRESKAD